MEGDFPDEASIFNRLGMEYREPKDRVDARSVRLTAAVATGAQARAQARGWRRKGGEGGCRRKGARVHVRVLAAHFPGA